MISKKAKKEHLANAGIGGCPFCGEKDLTEYGEIEPVEDGHIEQIGTCLKCNKRWKDIFTLVDVTDVSGTSLH